MGKNTLLDGKRRSGSRKTKRLHHSKSLYPFFSRSHCVVCPPARSLNHVTISLKRVACEQALLFGREASRARTRERAAKPRGAEERRACNDLSKIFICTSLRRSEIPLAEKWRSGNQSWSNRPSWPALNFRGNIETRCSYRQNPCYVGDRWTHSEKTGKKTSGGRN